MAIGFGKSTTGKNDIIKSLQQSYIVDDELLYQQRREWDEEYLDRVSKQFSENQLFAEQEYSYLGPECFRDFDWNPNSSTYQYRTRQRIHEVITCGYWALQVLQDMRGRDSKHFQEWDFSILVWSGDRFVFHPQQARKNITRQHGAGVFDEWRDTVLSDLDNFADVIKAYNPPVSMFSITCCKSSERVCKRLGLDVRRGYAYLTNRKGEPCEHKTGSFASRG